MRKVLVFLLTGLLAIGLLPSGAAARPHHAERARGDFSVSVDFASLTLDPLFGTSCVLRVEGTLTFTGTLVGTATGRTTALVPAPCDDVAAVPPGTYADVFWSDLAFVSEDGRRATIAYVGTTAVGGEIRAVMHLDGDLQGLLRVDAVVARDGEYRGWVRGA